MKNFKKTLTLNRAILCIMLAGYSTLLILLLCMDYFLIMEYQTDNHKREQQAMDSYLAKTTDGMERIRRILYDIYTYDEDFAALSGSLSEVAQYSHAYDLRRTLYSQMMVDEELQGFYIFYNAKVQPLYKVDVNQIEAEHAMRIGKALRQKQQENEWKASNWTSITIDNSVYLVLAYEKGNVTVYGIRNLGNAQRAMNEESGEALRVILLNNGSALTNEKLAENLGIMDNMKKASDRFSYHMGSNQVYGERIPNTELWICSVFPRGFWDYVNLQQVVLLVLTGLSFLAVLSLYFFLKRNLVKPLRALSHEMEMIRNEKNRDIPLMDMRFSELKEVNETLRAMVIQLEKQRLLTYDEFIEKQKAQMQYLQLQLKPHFYLNGLKTLNALVLENQTEKVQTLILNLSEHLRYLLQSEVETTSLRQELDFADNYVNLQSQMTGRRMHLDIEMEPEAAVWRVPVLSVQTFVENSIKHAKLGSLNSVLLIKVRADLLTTEEGNYLDLVVRDNGQGYPEDVLNEINGAPKAGNKNVGINNLKRRCQILYGRKAEFTFLSRDGAVSECIIPEREVRNS